MNTIALATPHTPWIPERVESFDRLTASLGVDLPFDDWPHNITYRAFTDRESNRVWSQKLFRWALDTGASHLLQLQDDAIVAPRFWPILRAMIEAQPTRIIGLEATHPLIPVPDVGTRVSGVQAGDYDYAEMISGDLYDTLSKDKSVQVQRTNAPIFGLFFMNSKEGILKDNFKLRRAIQTALDKAPALRVAFGPKDLWNAEGSIYPKGTAWYSTAGTENYSPHDAKKAKELAKEAGYTGTPIRLLVSTNYQAHYDEAAVFTRQLADAGINVQMNVVDWATLLKMRGQAEQWDIFVTHHTFFPDPILFTFLNASYPGWWDTPEIKALRAELVNSSDQTARKATWDKIQALIYEQVPVIKVGDAYTYDIASPKLKDLNPNGPAFWNVSTK